MAACCFRPAADRADVPVLVVASTSPTTGTRGRVAPAPPTGYPSEPIKASRPSMSSPTGRCSLRSQAGRPPGGLLNTRSSGRGSGLLSWALGDGAKGPGSDSRKSDSMTRSGGKGLLASLLSRSGSKTGSSRRKLGSFGGGGGGSSGEAGGDLSCQSEASEDGLVASTDAVRARLKSAKPAKGILKKACSQLDAAAGGDEEALMRLAASLAANPSSSTAIDIANVPHSPPLGVRGAASTGSALMRGPSNGFTGTAPAGPGATARLGDAGVPSPMSPSQVLVDGMGSGRLGSCTAWGDPASPAVASAAGSPVPNGTNVAAQAGIQSRLANKSLGCWSSTAAAAAAAAAAAVSVTDVRMTADAGDVRGSRPSTRLAGQPPTDIRTATATTAPRILRMRSTGPEPSSSGTQFTRTPDQAPGGTGAVGFSVSFLYRESKSGPANYDIPDVLMGAGDDSGEPAGGDGGVARQLTPPLAASRHHRTVSGRQQTGTSYLAPVFYDSSPCVHGTAANAGPGTVPLPPCDAAGGARGTSAAGSPRAVMPLSARGMSQTCGEGRAAAGGADGVGAACGNRSGRRSRQLSPAAREEIMRSLPPGKSPMWYAHKLRELLGTSEAGDEHEDEVCRFGGVDGRGSGGGTGLATFDLLEDLETYTEDGARDLRIGTGAGSRVLGLAASPRLAASASGRRPSGAGMETGSALPRTASRLQRANTAAPQQQQVLPPGQPPPPPPFGISVKNLSVERNALLSSGASCAAVVRPSPLEQQGERTMSPSDPWASFDQSLPGSMNIHTPRTMTEPVRCADEPPRAPSSRSRTAYGTVERSFDSPMAAQLLQRMLLANGSRGGAGEDAATPHVMFSIAAAHAPAGLTSVSNEPSSLQYGGGGFGGETRGTRRANTGGPSVRQSEPLLKLRQIPSQSVGGDGADPDGAIPVAGGGGPGNAALRQAVRTETAPGGPTCSAVWRVPEPDVAAAAVPEPDPASLPTDCVLQEASRRLIGLLESLGGRGLYDSDDENGGYAYDGGDNGACR